LELRHGVAVGLTSGDELPMGKVWPTRTCRCRGGEHFIARALVARLDVTNVRQRRTFVTWKDFYVTKQSIAADERLQAACATLTFELSTTIP
jgi:hypothetical protein